VPDQASSAGHHAPAPESEMKDGRKRTGREGHRGLADAPGPMIVMKRLFASFSIISSTVRGQPS